MQPSPLARRPGGSERAQDEGRTASLPRESTAPYRGAVTNLAEPAAWYAIGATLLAFGLVVSLHVLEPEYDPSWRMLSEYALGRFGILMRVAFVAAATGVIAVAVALSGPAGVLPTLLLVLVALGPLGAAFIDTDPITTPAAAMSTRGKVHAALGSLFIFGFPFAATAVGLGAWGDPAVGPVLAWASAFPWLAVALFLTVNIRSQQPDHPAGPDVPIGWPNRLNMVAYLGWVILGAALVLS